MQFVRAFKEFSVNHGCVIKDLTFQVIIFNYSLYYYILLIIIFFPNFHLSSKNEEYQLTRNKASKLSFIFLLFFFTIIVCFCVGEEGSFWIELVL